MKSERKVDKKKHGGDSALFERKEPKESDFTSPGELETGYTEKSWTKPEDTVGKEIERTARPQERIEPSEKEFTTPRELETGYTDKSWTKPEKSIEDEAAGTTEETRHDTPERNILRKDMEAREREAREREPWETKERGDLAAREMESSKREAREKEKRKREAKEAR